MQRPLLRSIAIDSRRADVSRQFVTNLRLSFLNSAPAILLQRDTLLAGVVLTPELVDRLMDYMTALTDDAARALSRTIPVRVPSKLPVDRP